MSDDFERSPPPPPLPLADWLRRSDRADNYREPFFSGRELEYGAFREAARGLAAGFVGGETLVFQGAPGAGKSALMHECIAAVRAHSTAGEPWVALLVAPGTLGFPNATAAAIVDALAAERIRLAESASRAKGAAEKGVRGVRRALASLSERGGAAIGVKVGGRPPGGMDARAAFQSIERSCSDARVVLFVDEAQNTPESARDVVDALHRGLTGIALLPVFLGLGDTADVLEKRGISRPPADHVVELGALRADEARASLTMTFDAYDVHGRGRQRWVEALVELSQGWPQHLNRVAVNACRIAKRHEMHVDRAKLADALAAGEAAKAEYYRFRLRGIPGKHLAPYKRLALQLAAGESSSVAEDEIRTAVQAAGMAKEGDFTAWLATSLHRGLLAPASDAPGRYRIPIPSLATHLVNMQVEPSPKSSSASDDGAPVPS